MAQTTIGDARSFSRVADRNHRGQCYAAVVAEVELESDEVAVESLVVVDGSVVTGAELELAELLNSDAITDSSPL